MHITFHSLRFSAACCLFCLAATSARADMIETFNANGYLTDGAAIGGTLTIDTTAGKVTASNMTVGGSYNLDLTYVPYQYLQSSGGPSYYLIYDSNASNTTELNFIIAPSLVNFNGGSVGGGNIYYQQTGIYGANIESLDFSIPAVVPTPEPSSLGFLATGMGGLLLVARCRSRRGVSKSRAARA